MVNVTEVTRGPARTAAGLPKRDIVNPKTVYGGYSRPNCKADVLLKREAAVWDVAKI